MDIKDELPPGIILEGPEYHMTSTGFTILLGGWFVLVMMDHVNELEIYI